MSMEGTIVMGPHNNLLNGVAATFAAYYVFNLQYPKEVSSTLEFVQRYVYTLIKKIDPSFSYGTSHESLSFCSVLLGSMIYSIH